jgi:actin-related protein
MQTLLEYIFRQEMGVNASEHPMLFDDVPLNGRRYREGMCQLMVCLIL